MDECVGMRFGSDRSILCSTRILHHMLRGGATGREQLEEKRLKEVGTRVIVGDRMVMGVSYMSSSRKLTRRKAEAGTVVW